MAVKKVEKKQRAFQKHDNDTGSVEVQIGKLSEEIKHLQEHIALHPKDYDSKRSLLKKVAKRRTFLKYVKGKDLETYSTISKKIGLKV